jgi:hypothetical protein
MKRKLIVLIIILVLVITSLGIYLGNFNDHEPEEKTKNGDKLTGTGILAINKNYIVLKNIYIENYADHVVIEGNQYNTISNIHSEKSINGIRLRNISYSLIEDCSVVNAATTGFVMGKESKNNIIKSCKIISTPSGGRGISTTDYYLQISSSQNNLVEGCIIGNFHELEGSQIHYGHGFIIKDAVGLGYENSYNNTFKDCVALTNFGETFAVTYTANNNTFFNCSIIPSWPGKGGKTGAGIGIVARNNATDNLFENIIIQGGRHGIGFRCVGVEAYSWGGRSNVVRNVIVNDVGTAINLWDGAADNIVENIVIYKADNLLQNRWERSINNSLENSIICSVDNYWDLNYATSDSPLNISYSCFYNNGFNLSATNATNSIESDPFFVNSEQGDFHLSSEFGRWNGNSWVKDDQTSPCIDNGNPEYIYHYEPQPNGGRINVGTYGGTQKASKSSTNGEFGDSKKTLNIVPFENRELVSGLGNVYYVSTTGSNSNNGITPATAWKTITYAASMATTPGDTVYIKNGVYHDEEIRIFGSGNSTHPISFIGYDSKPNDNPNERSNMPIIQGGDNKYESNSRSNSVEQFIYSLEKKELKTCQIIYTNFERWRFEPVY